MAEGFRRRTGKDAPRAIQVVAHRSWFLLIPLLAFSWVSSNRLAPRAEEIRLDMEKEAAEMEQERLRTLAGVRVANTRISQMRALADTFKTRFDQLDAVMDSARAAAEVDRERIRVLQGILDSLRTVEAAAKAREAALTDSLRAFDASIDSLKRAIPLLAEQTQKLEEQAQANRELTDRVLYPTKYRRNNALIIGSDAAKKPPTPPPPPPSEEGEKP
jgi:hypothetical protein